MFFFPGADSLNFTVNENTGVISTNTRLDREFKDSYTILITATDSGSRANSADVTITVSDVNDNSPVCSMALYAGSVAENAVSGSSVLEVSCPDLDSEANGQVTKEILYKGDCFISLPVTSFFFVHW